MCFYKCCFSSNLSITNLVEAQRRLKGAFIWTTLKALNGLYHWKLEVSKFSSVFHFILLFFLFYHRIVKACASCGYTHIQTCTIIHDININEERENDIIENTSLHRRVVSLYVVELWWRLDIKEECWKVCLFLIIINHCDGVCTDMSL